MSWQASQKLLFNYYISWFLVTTKDTDSTIDAILRDLNIGIDSDVVVATSPFPNDATAWKYAQKYVDKWVINCRDPFIVNMRWNFVFSSESSLLLNLPHSEETKRITHNSFMSILYFRVQGRPVWVSTFFRILTLYGEEKLVEIMWQRTNQTRFDWSKQNF